MNWLRTFEAVGERVRREVIPLLGTEAGRRPIGRGAGGDQTVELDLRAEDAALECLRQLHHDGQRFSVLSEEAGLVDFGAEWPRLVLDPVDGSLNAKRGLPVVGVMISLLHGPRFSDVEIGYVENLVSGERWHAVRGGGAFRDGRRIEPMRLARPGRLEVLCVESPPRDLPRLQPLMQRASKLRLLGSMALSLAHTATGGVDVHCSSMRGRLFDVSASGLMVEEVGGVVTDLDGRPLEGLEVNLRTRTTLLASAHPDLHSWALNILSRVG